MFLTLTFMLLIFTASFHWFFNPFLPFFFHYSFSLKNSNPLRWWKEMDLISRLPYARDRVVESYFWSLGIYFEPQYASARIMLAKKIAVISVIDDTYDAYGTIEELKLFTDAIQKWDVREIDGLPEYMKISYRALLDLYESYDAELSPKGKSYAVQYAKDAMKEIVRSWQIEAEWFRGGYLASFDEYMIHGRITSGCYLLTAVALFGMDTTTPHVFDWLSTKPKILEADVILTRVIDDMATYKDEKGRGQAWTGIDCYKKEHGVSTQVAFEALHEVAENGWKDLNQGMFDSRVHTEILWRAFGMSRLAEVTYKHNRDGYTHPEKGLKPHIVALLVDSLQI